MRTTAALAVWLIMTLCPALASDCVDKLSPKSLYADVIPCLKEQLATISTLNTELSSVKQELTKVSTDYEAFKTKPVVKPAEIFNVTSQRKLGQVFQNTSGRTMLVMVTAAHDKSAYTIYGSVSKNLSDLPTGDKSGGSAGTVIAVSFANAGYNEAITFIVPQGFYYEVNTDLYNPADSNIGTVSLGIWVESLL